MPIQLLRFKDLRQRKVVDNRPTLARWIEREGFPPGRMLGPNTRVWTEAEIEEWIASRPVAADGRIPTTLLRKKAADSGTQAQNLETVREGDAGRHTNVERVELASAERDHGVESGASQGRDRVRVDDPKGNGGIKPVTVRLKRQSRWARV